MAKQLNVNMSFTADTSKAKQAVQQLQQDIQKLAYGTPQGIKVDVNSFQQASAAARELAFHLNNAYNANTGNLDLSKLNASLKQSGTNLTKLTQGFSQAGSVGQSAFISLAKAVANADMPALSLNTHLQTMLITLKNVARFQISSSIIHGAIGAIKSAYGYAQDLNESLNNIRIVTGQSVDQMANFAEEANKAAKSLSTSTLDYTKASLIYYQQGLSDSDVKARTDVTVKMANVSRQSAQEVSDQMTAIWNNFDNGSHSLEYYADVITALGAKTASSSQEIATGLEKFAAVADTVGLSYENATAALATITATTRQSAETVGNGLRTLFSRLQGLKLGETLEDGVDLNKYSAALESVGVHALDASGNLRSMDSILEDLGARWGELSEAQQTALAQTVGGVRQYTNLIALMDNFDFYKQNQKIAGSAEGTLQKQADIYAESWEAARNRVKTAAEGIYSSLIDEKFFIKLDKFLEHLLTGVKTFLDAFGGIKGLLVAIGGIAMNMIAGKIGPAMTKMAQDIQIMTGGADRVYSRMQKEMQGAVDSEIATGNYSGAEEQELRNASQLLAVRGKLSALSKNLTASEKMRADLAIQGLELEHAAVVELIKKRDELAQKQKANTDNLNSYKEISGTDTNKINAAKSKAFNSKIIMSDTEINNIQDAAQKAENIFSGIRSGLIDQFQNNTAGINIVTEQLQKLNTTDLSSVKNQVQNLTQYLDDATLGSDNVKQALQDIANAQETDQLTAGIQALKDALQETGQISLENLFDISGQIDFSNLQNQLNSAIKDLGVETVEEFKVGFADEFMTVFDGINIDESKLTSLWDSLYDGSGNFDAFLAKVKELGLEGNASVQQFIDKLYEIEGVDISSIQNQVDVITSGFKDLATECPQVEKALVKISKAKSPKDLQKGLKDLEEALGNSSINAEKVVRVLQKMGIPKSEIQAWQNGKKALAEISVEAENAKNKLSSIHIDFSHMVTGTEVFAKLGSTLMSAYTIANSLQTLFRTWENPDLTFGEKLTSSLMSVGMLIPAVTNAMSGLGTILDFVGQAGMRGAAGALAQAAALGTSATAGTKAAMTAALVAGGYEEEAAAAVINITTSAAYCAAKTTQEKIDMLVAAGIDKQTASTIANTGAVTMGTLARSLWMVLTGKMTAAEFKLIAAQAAESGGVWANTAAWVANQIAKNGWAGLVLGGLLLAAIVTTTAVIMSQTAEVEKNTKAQAEQAAASREAAAAADEERKKQVELEKAYEEKRQAYEEAKESGENLETASEELKTATEKVAEAYEIENAQLMIAAGLYDELYAKIKKVSDIKGKEAEKKLRDSLNSTAVEYGNKQSENTDEYWGSATEVGIGDGSLLGLQAEEQIMYEAKNNLKNSGAYGKFISVKESTGDLVFKTSSQSAEGYMQMYEAIAATVEEAERLAKITGEDLTRSELYTGSKAYLNNMRETYEQLKEATDKLGETSLDNLLVKQEDVKTVADYEAAVEDYTQTLLEQKDAGGNALFTEEEARKTAENFAATQYPELQALHEALKGINEDDHEQFMELWENSSDAARQGMLEAAAAAVLLDEAIPLDTLEAAAKEADHLAEGLKAGANVKFFKEMEKNAKKGKRTTEEWAADYDAHKEAFVDENGNQISKADFLLMTDQEKEIFSRRRQNEEEKKEKDIADEQYKKAKSQRHRLATKATKKAKAALEAQENLDNYLNTTETAYTATDMNGETYSLSGSQVQQLREAMATGDNQILYNKTQELGISPLINFDNFDDVIKINETDEYKELKKRADKAQGESEAATRDYNKNKEIRTSYEKKYKKSQEDIDAENAASFLERVEDADLKYDDVAEYAEKLGKIGENSSKSKQELLELSLATMQQAEESGIGAKKVMEYADELQKMPEFSELGADELVELSLAMQQMAEDTELNVDDIASYTAYLKTLPDFANLSNKEILDFAKTQMLFEQGLANLNNDFQTYNKLLKSGKENTQEYDKALQAVKKDIAGILGIDIGKVSDAFVKSAQATGLLEEAAKGSKEGVRDLQAYAGAWQYLNQQAGMTEEKLAEMTPEELSTAFTTEFENMGLAVDDFSDSMDDLMNRKPAELIPFEENSLVKNLANVKGLVDQSLTDINNIAKKFGFEYDWEPISTEITQEMVDAAAGAGVPFGVDGEQMYFPLELTPQMIGTTVNGYKLVAHNIGQGGGGSSGGGGGGGGDKKPPKPERYHVIKNKIQNNDRRTSTVTRNKDRAFGQARIDLLKEEQKLREKNLELQEQYRNEIEDWLAKDKEDLIKAYQELGLAVEFDEDGEISNFEELQQAYLDAFEDLDEEGEEAWKDAQEALEQYEESLDLLNDKLDEIEQAAQEAFDALLEEVELKVQLDIDISDDKMAYLDYLLEKIDDDAYAAAQAIALLGDKTAETMRKIETYQNGINDILNLHGLTMDDLNNLSPDELRNLGLTDQEVSDLREYRDALLDANKELLEMRTTIVDKVIDAFEQLNEKVQKAYEKFDQYTSVLEHYKNLSDLLIPSLGKQSKILMDQLNNAMFNNAKNQAAAARKVYEEAQKQWDEAKAGYDAAVASGDDNAIREYERILDTLTENLNEAQDNWLSAWEASLEQAQVIFEAAMENIQAEYDTTLGGTFGSLDYLQQAYDRQKELNDQYLQDYDRLYELSKLSRNISAAIDDTDSIKAKERLRALQAEINKLQADGTKLSEYDVQVLEKRFEIEKARLALDDAQNAKSQVRLQRDAEGNWGYVYTADEDAVAKAEQEYEDKLHEYQKLNDEYITQLQDQALEVQAQYRDAYMEIMNDTSLTDEERKARVDELNNWLAGQMSFFNEQLEHALTNQHSTLQRYYDAYGDLNAQLVDTWGETTLAEVLGMETMEGFMGNWQDAVDQMITAAAAAWENYRRQQDEANEAAGVSTEDVADHIASQISAIGTYSDEAKDQVSQLSEELTGEFTEAMKAALEWEEKYAQAIDDAVNKNEAFIISLNKMITALAGLEGQISWDFSGATQSSEQFGSGGYTGTWGPNGKLAVLHEKELVLNKEDTAKFLDALQILKMIDLSANWMQQGFGDFIGAPTIGELAQTLDQQVSINASFPGVKDRYEIEEAFNNLVNKASQYANRKESY